MTGRIKGRIAKIGSGGRHCQIDDASGNRFFAHISEFEHPFLMKPGEIVEFTPGPKQRPDGHPVAKNVVLIDIKDFAAELKNKSAA